MITTIIIVIFIINVTAVICGHLLGLVVRVFSALFLFIYNFEKKAIPLR